jgi:hypothetical protein
MSTSFVATEFAVVEEGGVLITTLGAPPSEEDGCYLMVQHKDDYDEQGVKCGMDQPYIEYCGQGWSWYGHILSFTVRPDGISVQMDSEAADRMQGDGKIEVQFDLSSTQYHDLQIALQRIFDGQAYFRVVA